MKLDDIVGITVNGILVVDGSWLFELKATHGLDFTISIPYLLEKGYCIDWVGFIEQARKNKWWDFQTYDHINYALAESIIDESIKVGIIDRFKLYVMTNTHPLMVE